MALDLAKITQNAVKAASQAGVTATATITRPVPPPDPLTGAQSGSASSQTVNVVQAEARKYAKKNDAAWTSVSTALFVAAADCTFVPLRGDRVAFGGRTLAVVVVEEYAPTGSAIGYYLGLSS